MDTEHGEHREIARLIGDLRRAERERDDLAATLETRNAEHALAMTQVREMEAERDAWRRNAESGAVSLADLKVLGEGAALVARGVRAEVMHLRAIIAGRTTPPTDAEIAAHEAAGCGWWLIVTENDFDYDMLDTVSRDEWVRVGAVRWCPCADDGRPCAWPAEVSR